MWLNLYSRKIISWVLSETLKVSHVVEYVEKKRVRNVEKPLIFHCDRGCQYVPEALKKATRGMIHSYSKKAYPWDYACIESFHALLKRELIGLKFLIMHMHISWFLNTSKYFTIPCAFTVTVEEEKPVELIEPEIVVSAKKSRKKRQTLTEQFKDIQTRQVHSDRWR